MDGPHKQYSNLMHGSMPLYFLCADRMYGLHEGTAEHADGGVATCEKTVTNV